MTEVTLEAQIDVLIRVGLGKRDTLDRVKAGLLKRPPEWIEAAEADLATIRAALKTIKQAKERANE